MTVEVLMNGEPVDVQWDRMELPDGYGLPALRDATITLTLNMTAFGKALAEAGWSLRRFRQLLRLRSRTGHRHRGERLWRTRYAAGRPDLPLGMRTAAKLRA